MATFEINPDQINGIAIGTGTLLCSGSTNYGTVSIRNNYVPFDNSFSNSYLSINQNQIMQNKVAVFKVTRNEENKIVSTEFIKEMWIETKNNESIDFIVARDKDLEMYKAEDLSIRSIWTVSF